MTTQSKFLRFFTSDFLVNYSLKFSNFAVTLVILSIFDPSIIALYILIKGYVNLLSNFIEGASRKYFLDHYLFKIKSGEKLNFFKDFVGRVLIIFSALVIGNIILILFNTELIGYLYLNSLLIIQFSKSLFSIGPLLLVQEKFLRYTSIKSSVLLISAAFKIILAFYFKDPLILPVSDLLGAIVIFLFFIFYYRKEFISYFYYEDPSKVFKIHTLSALWLDIASLPRIFIQRSPILIGGLILSADLFIVTTLILRLFEAFNPIALSLMSFRYISKKAESFSAALYLSDLRLSLAVGLMIFIMLLLIGEYIVDFINPSLEVLDGLIVILGAWSMLIIWEGVNNTILRKFKKIQIMLVASSIIILSILLMLVTGTDGVIYVYLAAMSARIYETYSIFKLWKT